MGKFSCTFLHGCFFSDVGIQCQHKISSSDDSNNEDSDRYNSIASVRFASICKPGIERFLLKSTSNSQTYPITV